MRNYKVATCKHVIARYNMRWHFWQMFEWLSNKNSDVHYETCQFIINVLMCACS